MPCSIVPSSFEHTRKEYAFSFNDDGVRCLKCKREIDIQAEIQAFESDCNIYNIINRYLYGDINALNQVQTTYADMAAAPRNLQEALNLSLRFKSDFYNLKPEVRAEFNNDFNQYIAALSSGKAFDVFKKFQVTVAPSNLDKMNEAINKIKEVNDSDNN